MFGRQDKTVVNDAERDADRFVPVGTVPSHMGSLVAMALQEEGIPSQVTESFDALIRGTTVAVISTRACDSDQAARVIGAHWR